MNPHELPDLPRPGLKILLGVSSSIAAYRALDLASVLRKKGASVRVVLTPNATKIAGQAAFEAITGNRAVVSLWESHHAGEMDHLETTKWADYFAIVPATANTLAVVAHGLASNALGTFAAAWNKSPLLIAPAMNPEMWRNAAVQENVAILRRRGHWIAGPVVGDTACRDYGEGRLAPVEDIYTRLVELIAHQEETGMLAGRRVLITSGPTREFADAVRCITNPSTGRMGMALCRAAVQAGAEVVLVTGPVDQEIPPGLAAVHKIQTADEMLEAVLQELPAADAVIFAAAVSDWKPAKRSQGKLKKTSTEEFMTMELVRTPDIAAVANRNRRPGQVFVGFAAEAENLEQYAKEKLRKKDFSLVFANPIAEAGAGFGTDTNHGLFLRQGQEPETIPSQSKEEIARILIRETARELAEEKSPGAAKTPS